MHNGNETAWGNNQSVLESLYELWINQDTACDDNVRELFEKLREWTDHMCFEERDRLTSVVVDLCAVYARKGFLDGARMSRHLLREILLEK